MTILDFKQLRRNIKKEFDKKVRRYRLSLLGDSATQFLSIALKGYAIEERLVLDIKEADYNQIDRQLLDPSSEYYQNDPEFTIIFKSVQKLRKEFYKKSEDSKLMFSTHVLSRFEEYVQLIQRGTSSKIIIFNFIVSQDEVFGNYGHKVKSSFVYQLQMINKGLSDLAVNYKDVFICDLDGIAGNFGVTKVIDDKIYITSDMVFSIDFLPIVARNVIDIINAILGKFKKCLILDLDNTLWGGVIGDDGISNIQIGDLGIGKAFSEIQLWIKQLKERGIILAICSKNSEEIAKEPFERHPEMILKLTDIAMFVANWDNKADNIKYIQETLNIGFDSMVFLDDNPFERSLVRNFLPEVCIPELPEDPTEYLTFLRNLNLFETSSYTTNDRDRTQQYQEEATRAVQKRKFANEEEFLSSLEMESMVSEANDFNTPRIAQLSQRSNQFNLRTQRYTEEDIARFAAHKLYTVLAFTLSDKFGDNGLISVVILKKEGDVFFIDTWIMSCRVLKRGMEGFVLNKIVEIARHNDVKGLLAEYLETPKNGMVKDHYDKLGFATLGNGKYSLNVNEFEEYKCFIKEIKK